MSDLHGAAPDLDHFLCSYDELLARVDALDPEQYDRTRSYLDGAVTWLSPFLTHGIISTRTIAERVLSRHPPTCCYRLLFELAWREYFHRCWQQYGDAIFGDLRHPQDHVESTRPPSAIVEAKTGIQTVDACIRHLLAHGTLHNHARLWIAAMTCNMGHTGWLEPARWLHYHLLDGDLASNTLSWQWVAGTFSHRPYLANQANVNKYARQEQHQSWLDQTYEALGSMATPEALQARSDPSLLCPSAGPSWSTPVHELGTVTGALHLRSLWDLAPARPIRHRHRTAEKDEVQTHEVSRPADEAPRRSIVFVDTELAARWPMSAKRWRFIDHWAAACDASIIIGEPDALAAATADADILRREYPACDHWPGQPRERDWLYALPERPWRSFSQFWKLVRGDVGV